jgi:hypothetical protein
MHQHELPFEIVLWFFELLDNIDDALHLAYCCRYFYTVFNSANVRSKVFKSIIVRTH